MVGRLKTPVSFFDKITNTKNPIIRDLQYFIDLVSKHDEYDPTLKGLYSSDKKEYDKRKKQLPGVVFGEYSERKDSACIEYSQCMGFDIDGITSNEDLVSILQVLQKIDYVFAAFPSVSGHGIRILVFTNATIDTHKAYYISIAQNLSDKLKLGKAKLDLSTKNPSRIWYYAPVDRYEIYLNEMSRIYHVDVEVIKSTAQQSYNDRANTINFSDDDKHDIIIQVLDRRRISGRNNFVMQYTKLATEYGLPSTFVHGKMIAFAEPSFTESEIVTTVNRNINSTSKRYDDPQIMKYAKIHLGESFQKSDIKKHEVKKDDDDKIAQNNQYIQIKDYLLNKYTFKRNELSLDIEVKENGKPFYDVLNENDIICELMEANFKSVDRILKAILNSSMIRTFNPLKDYLENLPAWDESKPDYITQLAGYVDAKKQDWFNVQFKKMLVRSLACSLGVIPFNKHCFTIIGNQNDGKTSFIRFLCPTPLKNYYTENMSLDKDGRISLANNIFINLDEIATISYHDRNKIKALISTENIKERLPFGTKPVKINRIANFFASTNDEEILTDSTGNVRWLIFEINHINHDNGGSKGYSQNIDVNLVYSQAIHLLNTGFKFQLNVNEVRESEDNNKEHVVSFTELDLIREGYDSDPEREAQNFYTSTDIANDLSREYPNLKIRRQMIGRALTHLGYKRDNSRGIKMQKRRKGYYLKKIYSDKISDSPDSAIVKPLRNSKLN